MRIQLEKANYQIGRQSIVSDVSFGVDGGEIVSIVGANGAGKSSVLKLLSGELNPNSGAVYFESAPLSDISLENRAQKLAVLPQKSGLEFPFLLREVIEMGRYPMLTGKGINQEIIEDVLREVDLIKLADRSYLSLSGGEKQRVHIARVLAQLWDRAEQACYLFDEPTAPLDLAHQLAFFRSIKKLAAKGASIILVIHDINLAARFSDRIIILNKGRVVADGRPKEVVTKENISEAFEVEVQIHNHSEDGVVQITY